MTLAVLAFACLSGPRAALADNTYQCDRAGGNEAILNACGARWQAANIRAHLAAGAVDQSQAACLASSADLLEQLAAKWSATQNYTEYSGGWPCGSQPNVPSDDNILAQACPGSVWSYENAGIAGCIITVASALPAQTTLRRNAQPDGPRPSQRNWIVVGNAWTDPSGDGILLHVRVQMRPQRDVATLSSDFSIIADGSRTAAITSYAGNYFIGNLLSMNTAGRNVKASEDMGDCCGNRSLYITAGQTVTKVVTFRLSTGTNWNVNTLDWTPAVQGS